MWQEAEWNEGLLDTVLRATDHALKSKIVNKADRTSFFEGKVTESANRFIHHEFVVFCSPKDLRRHVRGPRTEKEKTPQAKAYLAMEAKDVDSSFFHTDIISDMVTKFREEVNWPTNKLTQSNSLLTFL